MRAFLTGATGTVGREVARALRARDVELRIGARAPSAVAGMFPDVDDVVALDFSAGTVEPGCFEGAEAFFFMTPLIDEQVDSSRRVLDAAIAGGVRHVVRLSSRSAGWDGRSSLRSWHRQIDEMVRGSGVRWTILRPCSFFQNFITYHAATIRNMASIIVPQGEGLIPYVDAADIGDAVAECVANPDAHAGETYVLTGGRAYGPKGVAAEIGRAIGKPLTYIDIEEDQARVMMERAGTPNWGIQAALAVFAHARSGGEAAVDPALTNILSRPATTLTEFVDRNRRAWL